MYLHPTSPARSSAWHIPGLWLVGIVLLGGVLSAGWQVLRTCRSNFTELVAGLDYLHKTRVKKSELGQQLAVRWQRARLKNNVVRDLRTGRASLREAAAQYWDLVREDEVFQIHMSMNYHRAAPEDIIPRLLIYYVLDGWLDVTTAEPWQGSFPGELDPPGASRIINMLNTPYAWGVLSPTAEDLPGLDVLSTLSGAGGESNVAQVFSVAQSER